MPQAIPSATSRTYCNSFAYDVLVQDRYRGLSVNLKRFAGERLRTWQSRTGVGATTSEGQNTLDLEKVRQADTASQEVQQADSIQDLSRSYFCTIRGTVVAIPEWLVRTT
jgi:hypothetical protein